MSKEKIHQSVNPKASSPRNAFGVGYSTLFTSPAGLLLPSYVEDVKAGDKIKLSLSSITRTRPVNTAAFMSFDEKTDFWFVPYRLIWTDYNNWRLSQSIRRNTFQNIEIGRVPLLPHTYWSSLYNFVGLLDNAKVDMYNLNDSSCSFFLRQLDLLGYSIPSLGQLMVKVKNDSFGIYTAASRSEDNTESSGYRPGREDIGSGREPVGRWSQTSAIGNYRPGIPSVTEDTSIASILQKYYGKYDSIIGSPLNYFRLAAYQCIYQSHYRNEEYEPLDPSYYNVDNLFYNSVGNSSGNPPTTTSPQETKSTITNLAYGLLKDTVPNVLTLWKLFTPRYKNWRKDVFTGLKPTNLMSATPFELPSGSGGSSMSSEGQLTHTGKIPSDLSDSTSATPTLYDYLNTANAMFPHLTADSIAENGLLASNIRLLFAQDKFARQSLYADKDFKHQMKALFGVDAPEPDVPRYLGTHSSNISINEVTSTSAGEANFTNGTVTSVLGEVAGKGYQSTDGFVFEDSFNEDGIVMGIHYIMPRNNYNSYRINKFNTKLTRFDYYYPAFDGLGLSPVFARELSTAIDYEDITKTDVPNKPTNLLGYAPRYYEFKERQNEVHGVFMSGQTEENWTLTNNKNFIEFGSSPENFKIFPSVTDPIFSVVYDGSQATDPFMCYFNYDVTRISNMESLGIPNV